jgi:thiol-disulfide isomerase/thioredoxin
METLARAGIALLIISCAFALMFIHKYWLRTRVSTLLGDLGQMSPGTFTLVYFSTPTCAPCKTIQRPAIHQVSKRMGDHLKVVEIDASQQPEIASRWGVMSVPTTFVIDTHGKIRHVNHGVTRAEQLFKQIEGR